MKFTASKKTIASAVSAVARAAAKKSPLPVLKNVVITAKGTVLHLAATDLASSMDAFVTIAKAKEDGTVMVEASKLADVVKALPEGDVTLSVDGKGALQLKCGKATAKLPGAGADHFPDVPKPDENAEWSTVPSRVLTRLIVASSYCMSTDDTATNIAALYLHGDGERLRSVATDRHRLSRCDVADCDAVLDVLIPAAVVGNVRAMSESVTPSSGPDIEIELHRKGGQLYLRAVTNDETRFMLGVKLGDDAFIPYERVEPKTWKHTADVPREPLIKALKFAALSADAKGGVKLVFNADELTVESESTEAGASSLTVPCTWTGPAGFAISASGKYLIDAAASVVEDDAQFRLSGDRSPLLIGGVPGGDCQGLVMPYLPGSV